MRPSTLAAFPDRSSKSGPQGELRVTHRFIGLMIAAPVAALVFASAPEVHAGQAPGATSAVFTPAKTADGQPDLQGIWPVVNTAAWDLQDHPARLGVPGKPAPIPPG